MRLQRLFKRGIACLTLAALLAPGSLQPSDTAYAAVSEDSRESESVLSESGITLQAGEETVLRVKDEDVYISFWSLGNDTYFTTELSEDRMEVTIKAVMPGTETIAVYNEFFQEIGTCEITVEPGTLRFPERKITLIEGDTYTLTMPDDASAARLSAGYAYSGSAYYKNVSISQNPWMPNTYTITAQREGTAEIYAYFYENPTDSDYMYADVMEVEVLPRGIASTQVIMLPGEEETLKTSGMMENYPMTWSSSDPSVASIDMYGKVTAIREGVTTISLTGFDSYGMYGTYTCELNVYDPRLGTDTLDVILYHTAKLPIESIRSDSDIVWSSSDPDVAEYSPYSGGIFASGEGTCVITAEVYGKTLTCNVTVYNPRLNDEIILLTSGKTKTISVEDVPDGTSVTYTSGDTSVATVSKSGKITAKGEGSTAITVNVGETQLLCAVIVGNSKIIKTIQFAEDAIGSPYSNEKRMQDGYYDCSSLVWKSYKAAGVSVASSTYAPTAANMAKTLVDQGKAVAYEMMDADQLKPGDLIFYGGSGNGRYKGIWHVALYCGSYEVEYGYWGRTYTSEYGIIIDAGSGSGNVRCQTISLGEGTDSSVVLIARPLK